MVYNRADLTKEEIAEDNANKFASRSKGGKTNVLFKTGAMTSASRSKGGKTNVKNKTGLFNPNHPSLDGFKSFGAKGSKNRRGKGARQRAKAEEQHRIKAEWKEYTTDDGKKYYYNIVTRQSAWQIPIPFSIY